MNKTTFARRQIYLMNMKHIPLKSNLILVALSTLVFFSQQATAQFEFKFASEEEAQFYYNMGKRTAKQTWWFFDYRLKNHENTDYRYFRVYLEAYNLWVKDIKSIDGGRYEGVVDTELPYDQGTDVSKPIRFEGIEVDDWMIADDYYLRGGFTIRIKSFEERKLFMQKGQFRTACSATNDDFFNLSKTRSEGHEAGSEEFIQRFNGKHLAFRDSLVAHAYFNEYALKLGINGCVSIRFNVLPSGKIENIKIIQSPGGGLSEILKRALTEVSYLIPPDEFQTEPLIVTIPYCFKMELGQFK